MDTKQHGRRAYQFETAPDLTPDDSAFRFESENPVDIRQDSEGKPRRFEGVPYSGEPIRNHPWWGTVIFDLESTRTDNRVPALIGHDRNQRAGHAGLVVRNNRLEVQDGRLMSNEHGQAVAEESDQDFPWQMSVHIEPNRVEELHAGASVTVNGHEVQGPAHIFRDNVIKEISFTPTGWDAASSARAFARASVSNDGKSEQEQNMDKDKRTPEELRDELERLDTRFQKAQEKIEGLETERDELKAKAEKAEKDLQKFQRDARDEQVRAMFAEAGVEKPTDEQVAPYLDMDETQFSAVRSQFAELAKRGKGKGKASNTPVPGDPRALFSDTATDGEDPNGEQAAALRIAGKSGG